MDIYNLINSKSISKYCRKRKHQFNTLETGILIHRCKTISIEKKIAYYNELINNPTLYPNMTVKKRCNIDKDTTAIDLIKQEVDSLKFSLDLFYKPDENAVFTLETLELDYRSDERWFDADPIFKTLHDVNDYVVEEVVTEKEDKAYRISKKYLNEDHKHITLTYKRNDKNDFELFDINNTIPWEYGGETMYHSGIDGICFLWINVPTPFKKGDIVTTANKGIAVIDRMCNKSKRFLKLIEDGRCDSSDMNYSGYYYCDCNKKIVLDHIGNYDEFEYYTEELKGFDRVLKAISSLTTNKIHLNLFLDAYSYIKAEETVEKEKFLFSCYIPEGLKLAGLNKVFS